MDKSDKERIMKLITDLRKLEKVRKLSAEGARHLKMLMLELDNINER